jgi:hypothetical protein
MKNKIRNMLVFVLDTATKVVVFEVCYGLGAIIINPTIEYVLRLY